MIDLADYERNVALELEFKNRRKGFCCVLACYVLFVTRGILEMKLQNVMFDRKRLYESHSVQLREINRYRMSNSTFSTCKFTPVHTVFKSVSPYTCAPVHSDNSMGVRIH